MGQDFREAIVVYRGNRRKSSPIHSSLDAHKVLREVIPKGAMVEHVAVLMLDPKHRPLAWATASIGSAVQTHCTIADLFRAAVHCGASAMVMAHNHPSGDPSPSPQDVDLTNQAEAAGVILGIKLMDHVILGDDNTYFSFLDNGLLGEDDL